MLSFFFLPFECMIRLHLGIVKYCTAIIMIHTCIRSSAQVVKESRLMFQKGVLRMGAKGLEWVLCKVRSRQEQWLSYLFRLAS